MVESQVTLTISLEVATRQDADVWVAWCRSLDVFGQGSNKSEAIASVKHAVELWFESCLDRGVLDEALVEAGFQRANGVNGQRTGIHQSHVIGFASEFIDVTIPAYITARP